jgi:outer membrane protein
MKFKIRRVDFKLRLCPASIAGAIFLFFINSALASDKSTLVIPPSEPIQSEEAQPAEPAITKLAEPLSGTIPTPSPQRVYSLEAGIPKTPDSALKHPIPSLYGPDPFGREATQLTLDQSIQIAIKLATAALKARNDDQAAGFQLLQGYGQFLPTLAVSGTFNYQSGRLFLTTGAPTSITTENFGPSYQVISTLNIFNGLGDLSALRSALANKSYTELSLKRARQQVSLDVAQSYLQVILDRQIVKIANKNLASSQARQDLLEEQTRVGVRNLSDLFRQQAQTSLAESYVISSNNKERTDELLLLRKLRLNLDHNFILEEPLLEKATVENMKYSNEAQLLKIALENRSDFEAAQKSAESAKWAIATTAASYYPRLDLGFNLLSNARTLSNQLVNGTDQVPSFQDSLLNQLGNNVSYTVGLNLSWSIFDHWSTRASVARAKTNSDNLEIDAVDRQKQVMAEVRQAFGDYRTALQQLDTTKHGLVAAEKAYEVVKGRYEVGSASFVDLITAQTTLVQAESARAQAVISFALQTRTMENVLGTS